MVTFNNAPISNKHRKTIVTVKFATDIVHSMEYQPWTMDIFHISQLTIAVSRLKSRIIIIPQLCPIIARLGVAKKHGAYAF